MNVPQALTVSSDVYFYWVGDHFWIASAINSGTRCRTRPGRSASAPPSGIPIMGEQSGLIIDPETKTKLHEQNPEGFPYSDWFPGDDIQGAIGQSIILVTPLQLANVYATIANGGTVYQPQVVARILKPNSNPNDPEQCRPHHRPGRQGPARHAGGYPRPDRGRARRRDEPLRRHRLRHVPGLRPEELPHRRPRPAPRRCTGKADTSVFAVFAPVPDPQYAGAAVLEESGFGADAAAPVMRRVLELLSGQQITNVGDILVGKAD